MLALRFEGHLIPSNNNDDDDNNDDEQSFDVYINQLGITWAAVGGNWLEYSVTRKPHKLLFIEQMNFLSFSKKTLALWFWKAEKQKRWRECEVTFWIRELQKTEKNRLWHERGEGNDAHRTGGGEGVRGQKRVYHMQQLGWDDAMHGFGTSRTQTIDRKLKQGQQELLHFNR